jgi:hypothetical protein
LSARKGGRTTEDSITGFPASVFGIENNSVAFPETALPPPARAGILGSIPEQERTMSDPSRRVSDLIAAADRSMKATQRALLALEAVVEQTKGVIAELREAHAAAAGPTRTAKRRNRAKVGP